MKRYHGSCGRTGQAEPVPVDVLAELGSLTPHRRRKSANRRSCLCCTCFSVHGPPLEVSYKSLTVQDAELWNLPTFSILSAKLQFPKLLLSLSLSMARLPRRCSHSACVLFVHAAVVCQSLPGFDMFLGNTCSTLILPVHFGAPFLPRLVHSCSSMSNKALASLLFFTEY